MTEAKQKAKTSSMAFNSLKQTNQKLHQNPDLSEHNKEVLQDFFRKARSGGAGNAILRDYASRFNKLAEEIDFELDDPDQRDLERIVAAFNTDNIRKNNGDKYSDYSKDKFWSTLSKFYSWFIKKQGKGYNEAIDGPELLEDLEIKVDLSVEVDSDRKPTPEEVKEVANQADTLRDKAIILFGWATGARVGEIFETQYNDRPLLWKDLEFRQDKIWVTLDGKTGEREIPVKTSKPVMEDYWDSCKADLDEPVFRKENSTSLCPKCNAELNLKGTKCAYEDREYRCPECNWEGPIQQVKKKKKALTANAVRRILRKLVKRADLKGKLANIDHDLDPKAVKDIGMVKKLTSGNGIMAEYKHENKFKLKPRAKLLFSANRVPDRTEEDDAFYNRWLTVTFPESIPSEEQDKELTEKLTGLADIEEREESQKHEGKLEGVLAWSLIGLKRLETQGEFTGDLDPLATKELWKEWGNSVERFISRYCIKENQVSEERAENEDFKVHVSTLYDLYQQYARFQGMETESKKGFTMKLKKETGVRSARPSINGEQQRGFFGLKLKEDAAQQIEERK